MIGVAVRPSEREITSEFFELFKTPWEFYRQESDYDVVISTGEKVRPGARLTLVYSSGYTVFDLENKIEVRTGNDGATYDYLGQRLPIYGRAAAFPVNRFMALKHTVSLEAGALLIDRKEEAVLRVGYDLFSEIRHLLTVGQPAKNAEIPTLEIHIGILRESIRQAGLTVMEIPPIPEGYSYVVCLTHDVDQPALKKHVCDHTMFGFVYRATIGSVVQVLSGRKSVKDLYSNIATVMQLPFVYLGLARDPWGNFDRYLELETGLGATYFVVPKKDYAGRGGDRVSRKKRPVRYEMKEIEAKLFRILSAGGEIGVHGLDAWLEEDSAIEERREVSRSLGSVTSGVRMHWLFFGAMSPAVLDQAGFSYDSTVGYNETVGFRAGTAQAYRPPGATAMLELPLVVMDTALFSAEHLGLSAVEAKKAVGQLVKNAQRYGGALVVNWHDRSIAPDRLWEAVYRELLDGWKREGAWFPTATQAVAWFRKRRSVAFRRIEREDGSVSIGASALGDPGLPGLRMRTYPPWPRNAFGTKTPGEDGIYLETGFDRNVEMPLGREAQPCT